MWGNDYERAYEQFYRDHDQTDTLQLHLLCLVAQLANNFALLACVEEAFGWSSWLRVLTAVCWAVPLATPAGCPASARAASFLALACAVAAAKVVQRQWRRLVLAQGVVVALAIDALVIKRRPTLAVFCGAYAAWLGAAGALFRHRGVLKGARASVNVAVVAVAVALASRDDPLRGGLVHFGAFALWALALATDQAWLFFYGLGFIATVAQGCVHVITDQEATLLQLQEEESDRRSAEWSHVLYFPNLTFHASLELLGRAS